MNVLILDTTTKLHQIVKEQWGLFRVTRFHPWRLKAADRAERILKVFPGNQVLTASNLVEMIGLEPTTSAVQRRRSPKLSYIPNDLKRPGLRDYGAGAEVPASYPERAPQKKMVGLARVELATSSLSGMRSNQLSYKPTYHSQKKKPTGLLQVNKGWRCTATWRCAINAHRNPRKEFL